MSWLENPALKWFVPLPIFAALAPLVWLVFRGTWRELEREAFARGHALREAGKVDFRPLAVAILGTTILTLQEYFGKGAFYAASVRTPLAHWAASHSWGVAHFARWDEFYGHAWWGLTRIGGYLLPLAAWKILFPRDRLLDFGLRTRGFRAHLWIYAGCVAVVVPILLLVRRQPDFGAYYPFYKQAGRSWLDLAAWESIYLAQFLALEVFFRGWWIGATRSFGTAAIFAAAVPYCMIHFGKPYLEAMAALVAGVVLGSLAVRTRSIWAGFLAHATVALLMDVLALQRMGTFPSLLAPGSTHRFSFHYWNLLPYLAWAGALGLLAPELRRVLPALFAWWRRSRGAEQRLGSGDEPPK
jgi:membrane protease YdiL (CAAX protease family)